MDREPKAQSCARSAALSLICVLLIFVCRVRQANHVHTGNSGSANHECSVCSVAHSGALISVAYRPVPVFVRSVLVARPGRISAVLAFRVLPYIRPPPSV